MKKAFTLAGATHVEVQHNVHKNAFTLAEVLITLGIIGVVAALTMPSLMAKHQEAVRKTQFKKAFSLMSNAISKSKADLDFTDPQCAYWETNPYGSAPCVEWDSIGNCTRHELTNGDPLPSDYNGNFADCAVLTAQIFKNLTVVKHCPKNAFSGGCIPDYNGIDSARKEANDELSDYDINKATSGCGGYRKANIHTSSSAHVLKDGTIILGYGSFTPRIFAIDINGHKGPNKWGYDIFSFASYGSPKKMYLRAGGCDFAEKGGVTSATMLNNANK